MSYFPTLFHASAETADFDTALVAFSTRASSSVAQDLRSILASFNNKHEREQFVQGLVTFHHHIWGLEEDLGIHRQHELLLADLFLSGHSTAFERSLLSFELSLTHFYQKNEIETYLRLSQARLERAPYILQSTLFVPGHSYGYTVFRWGERTLLCLINRGYGLSNEVTERMAEGYAPSRRIRKLMTEQKPSLRVFEIERSDEKDLLTDLYAMKYVAGPLAFLEEVALGVANLLASVELKAQSDKSNCTVITRRHLIAISDFITKLRADSPDPPDTLLARSAWVSEQLQNYRSIKDTFHLFRYESLLVAKLQFSVYDKSYQSFLKATRNLPELLKKLPKSKAQVDILDQYDRPLAWDDRIDDIYKAMTQFALAVTGPQSALALSKCLELAEFSFKRKSPDIIKSLFSVKRNQPLRHRVFKKLLEHNRYPLNGKLIAEALFEQEIKSSPDQSISSLHAFCRHSSQLHDLFLEHLMTGVANEEFVWRQLSNPAQLRDLQRLTPLHAIPTLYTTLLKVSQKNRHFFRLACAEKRPEYYKFIAAMKRNLSSSGMPTHQINELEKGFKHQFYVDYKPSKHRSTPCATALIFNDKMPFASSNRFSVLAEDFEY